jgi:hypothetical protein
MEEKTISIPFNHEDFIRNQKVKWSFQFKKALNNYITYTIIPIPIFIMGFLLQEFYINLVGFLFLFYIALKWIELFQKRKKYFKNIRNLAKRYEQESMDCTFTISQNGIQYLDKEKLYKMNWSLFNPYLIFKDTIILTAKDSETIMFTISRNDVGIENYQEICAILEDIVGKNK